MRHAFAGAYPEHLRIPKLTGTEVKDPIAGVRGEGPATVDAVGQRLRLPAGECLEV
jgi:hypothetical protein